MNTGFLREQASAKGQIEADALDVVAVVLVAVAEVFEDASESLEPGGAWSMLIKHSVGADEWPSGTAIVP